MLTAKERGTEATWLAEARRAKWSNQELAARAITKATGVTGLSKSVLAEYESGRRTPSEKHREAFAQVFGPMPTGEPAAALPDMARFLEAMDRQAGLLELQTLAINRLVAQMALAQEREPRWARVLAAASVQTIVAQLQSAEEGLAQPARPRSDTPHQDR